MRVKLTYFKESGKYYTEGEYESSKTHAFEVYQEVYEMLNKDTCPGISGRASQFKILVQPENGPPHLVVP